MRTTGLVMSRTLALLAALALALTLLVAPSSAVAVVPAEEREDDATATSNRIQQDLASLTEVQSSARLRLDLARKDAKKNAAKMRRNKKRVAKAEQLVSVHLRSIYIYGATELTMLASMIDTAKPGDLIQQGNDLLRVGGHKDNQLKQAVELLKRTEEAKKASDAAVDAAEDSLAAVGDQVKGLLHRRADVAGELADRIQSSGSVVDAAQAKRNSQVALAWAAYLGMLAKYGVQTFSTTKTENGKKSRLPKGLTKDKQQPGIAIFKKGKKRIVVLPERTIAEVTYAVSKLGGDYRWKANTDSEMDCSSLVDRSWNVPALDADERKKERELVPGGVRGLARTTRLLTAEKRRAGDLLFLSDPGAGVNHVGIAVTKNLMIASDSTTGAVNALPISEKRLWKAGRLALPAPKRDNAVPKASKQPYQCGADPDSLISLPDGKVLGNAESCPPAPGLFSEAHMQPNAIRGARCAAHTWPQIASIGGYRPHDAYPDHPSGLAIDVMIPGGCALEPTGVQIGNAVAAFFSQNAAEFDVAYIIWSQRMWNSNRDPLAPPQDWRTMGDRGGCTSNHMDHVHITFNGLNPSSGSGGGSASEGGDN